MQNKYINYFKIRNIAKKILIKYFNYINNKPKLKIKLVSTIRKIPFLDYRLRQITAKLYSIQSQSFAKSNLLLSPYTQEIYNKIQKAINK